MVISTSGQALYGAGALFDGIVNLSNSKRDCGQHRSGATY